VVLAGEDERALDLGLVDRRAAGSGVLLDDREQIAEKRAFLGIERGGRARRNGGGYGVDRRTVEACGDRGHLTSVELDSGGNCGLFGGFRGQIRARLGEAFAVGLEHGRVLEARSGAFGSMCSAREERS
jgi:hypothetical protein